MLMAAGGKTGEQAAVVHRHEKLAVINAGFVFIGDHPESSGSSSSGFAVADESPKSCRE